MKKIKFIIVFLLIVLVSVAVWFLAFGPKDKSIDFIEEKPHYGSIALTISATGTVQPVDTVAVGTQVSGTIKKVFADFNSVVKKGQLLAQLDQSLLLDQAQQVRANLQQSQSNLIYQLQNFKRQNDLFNADAISKADFETAKNLHNSAKDNVINLKAQLKAAQKNLSFTNIYSPIDGTILSRNISEGQTVASSFSTPTLFIIAKDLTKMQVRASVDEADIGNVRKDEIVTFTVDAFPDDIFKGTVEEIRLEPSVSSNVVTYTTIINAENKNLKLKPGMTANITIYTIQKNNTMLISATALKFTPDPAIIKMPVIKDIAPKVSTSQKIKSLPNDDKKTYKDFDSDSNLYKEDFVWVLKDDSIFQRRIFSGLNDDVNIQVASGLDSTDVIVTGIADKRTKSNKKSMNQSPFMPARPGQSSNSINNKKQ